jgi:hypothetical protein
MTRFWWALAVLVLALTSVARLSSREDRPAGLKVGKTLPGPFHPYNITGPVEYEEDDRPDAKKEKKVKYSPRGKYHCLVSQYGLNPVVMLVARDGMDDNTAFRALLKRLDAAAERNPTVRLGVFVVFLLDKVPDVVADDDEREKAAADLKKLAEGLSLKKVVLCLGSTSDLEKYKLDPKKALTAVLYKKLQVLGLHELTADKVDSGAVDAIMKDVRDKLGAPLR